MIFLAFFLPLAIYFLTLSYLNRGRHPTLVRGSWDFAGVLFGASGFLLLGGPAILTGFHDGWRTAWVLGRTQFLNTLGESWYFWACLHILYFLGIGALSTFLVWRHRMRTTIYNIQPSILPGLLREILEERSLSFEVLPGHRYLIRSALPLEKGVGEGSENQRHYPKPVHATPNNATSASRAAAAVTTSAASQCALEIDLFPFFCHASLHWQGCDAGLRDEIERDLAIQLEQIPSPENPAGSWFMSVAVVLFMAAFLALALYLLIHIKQSL